MQVRRSASLTSPESSMFRYLKMRKAVSCILGSFQKTLSAHQFWHPSALAPTRIRTRWYSVFFGRTGFRGKLELPSLFTIIPQLCRDSAGQSDDAPDSCPANCKNTAQVE